jgi:hypothetical protein
VRLRDLRILGTFEAVARDLDGYLREVREILNGGLRLRDQVRVVRDVVIDTAVLPVSIEVPAGLRPIGVVLVRAVEQGTADGQVISGGAVTWDAQGIGSIRIHVVDALAASTRYDAVIAVVE